MNKQDITHKLIFLLALVLLFRGMAAVGGSFLGQAREEEADMQEYAQLLEQARQVEEKPVSEAENEKPEMMETAATPSPASAVSDETDNEAVPSDEPEYPEESASDDTAFPAESSVQEETSAPQETFMPEDASSDGSSTGTHSAPRVNLSALKAQNSDFIAWLRIPGTGIDYPVVWSDDTDYYLHHTFAGKESSVGTLISERKTDYAAPSQNIAIYGHHLRTNNMFTPLLSYKKKSFWQAHDTVELHTLYGSGTYRIFAALIINIRDWEPSAPDFADEASFMAFVNRAKSESFYGTGVEVSAADEILTLITCDRSYAGADGRLVVMAVKQ